MRPENQEDAAISALPTILLAQPAVLTVGDVLTLYLQHSAAINLHCPDARSERERVFALFAAQQGHVPVTDVKPYQLEDFIVGHPSWRSTSTRRAKANMIRAAFQWATDRERIARNPFKSVKYDEAERRPDMPDDYLKVFMSFGNKPFERALNWLRFTGCRLSELCEAVWLDVDLDLGIWTIPKHKSRRYTKKAKVVALVPEAVELLVRMRREAAAITSVAGAENALGDVAAKGVAAPAENIFRNNRGTPWNRITLGQQLRRLKDRHGLAVAATLHGIRHRYGTCGVKNGAPLKLLSQQLGHASQAITERYYVDLSTEIDAIRAAAQLALPK